MKGKKYLEFLRYCLDDTLPIPESSSKINWMRMMDWAEGQSIVGVIYGGIQKAGKALNIPFDDLMEWIGYAQDIENHNKLLNKKCVEVVKEFQEAGFDCMVLKGQGNAMMYPNPLLRNPGDIDVWIYGLNKNMREEIVKFAKTKEAEAEVRYYHVGYQDGDVEVEAHFMPGIMNNPVYNRRLQSFYKKMANGGRMMEDVALPDKAGRIPVPTWEFNIVFQLAHMMHHFFDEGIGLRQMIDYFYLLKSDGRSQMEEGMHHTSAISHQTSEFLKHLNLYKFAGAVMYVMKEALGMDEKCLIVPVDERRGKTLLQEIMEGGNFGRSEGRWKMSEGRGKKYFVKIWRNLHFVREYPAETLCEPFFRTWHFFWRMVH